MSPFGYGHHTPQVEHVALMIHHAVERIAQNVSGADRFVDRLKSAIDQGVAISIDSGAARIMAHDAAELHALADTLVQCRAALVQNGQPRLRLVATE